MSRSHELWFGDTIPAPRATVTARLGSSTVTTTADDDGRFLLPLVGGGTYDLSASLAAYQALAPVEVTAPISGCVSKDIAVEAVGIVSGTLRQPDGQPAQGGQVGLIPLKPDGEANRAQQRTARVRSGDGYFAFEGVPLGRFHLVTNPEGPRDDRPNERTYYPGAASRSEAQVIDVTEAAPSVHGLDVTTGSPVRLRDVEVAVTGPAGQALRSIQVQVTATGVGLDLWQDRDRSDSVTRKLRVPANRRLTIEALDRHGRDLKSEYKSTHEPGLEPVRVRFVIQP